MHLHVEQEEVYGLCAKGCDRLSNRRALAYDQNISSAGEYPTHASADQILVICYPYAQNLRAHAETWGG